MASGHPELTLPIVRLRSRWFDLRIDTGELLFPTIVLLFCGAYFYETRGLPEQSMLYAGPLLYATALLAVVTILGHAVSLSTEPNGGGDQSRTDARQPVVWGVEKSVVEQEHPREEPEPTEDVPEDTESVDGESSQFTLQSAVGLAALSTGYVASLYLVPFVLSTAAFLAATVVLFGERDVLRIAGYSVGFTLVLWLVFINWLLVPLP